MKKTNRKIRNPLIKRVPRELAGDRRKYLIVSLFLILVIGFVSGMYVANESMMTAIKDGGEKYKLEDGHFELTEKADEGLLSAIRSGKKADVKAYYTEKARAELDGRFEEEFKEKFTKEFDGRFAKEFEASFAAQLRDAIVTQMQTQMPAQAQAQTTDEAAVSALLQTALEQAKQNGEYQAAYDSAYGEAYAAAYGEAYRAAYAEAWKGVLTEIDEKYADAEEKYKLNDPDFKPVPVRLCENFYRNEEEDSDGDGKADGTVRIYAKTEEINLACLLDGRFPEAADEIAIDRMHADNAGIRVGDDISVSGERFRVVGLLAYVNYSTLHEKNTDLIFDALKFSVAMVTEEGFDRLGAPVHYTYAWQYEEAPASDVTEPADAAEKKRADSVLSSLLTQTAVFENELIDFLPGYANQAIRFAPDDMGGDMAIGGVLLDILTVIIAFIFAITISNTISTEARAIGTLRASGYTKGELIRHYLAPPVAVTLLSAAAGNLLGYTVLKNTVVSMYYNSYSLPTYRTLWSPTAFLKTTLVPLLLMFLVNLAVIAWKMQYSPLRFLRGDLKRDGRRRAVRLPNLKFFRRFRLRIILQNLPSYLVLFFGVLFVSVMLAMAVGMPDTLDYYKENADGMMLANYQYILNSYKNEDGSAVRTENADAEPFCMRSLQRKGGAVDEEIGVYGILPDSRCVAADLRSLTGNEVYISDSFRDKYGVSAGDTVTLDEKYENRRYSFKVVGFYDRSASLAVFLTAAQFRTVFGEEADAFTGFLSGSEITDLPDGAVAAVVTSREITKMCDQLDHSMGSYMQYFQVLCILLSAVMLYLLSKLVIEKNGIAISIVKILGYEDREIASLYLRTTALVLLLADAVCTALGGLIMRAAWGAVMAEYSGWYAFRISPVGYAKMFLFVLIGYLLVMFFDYRRIRKIPMEQALKNAE